MAKRKTIDGYVVFNKKSYGYKLLRDRVNINEAVWTSFLAGLFQSVYEFHAPLLCALGPRIKGQHEYLIAAVTTDGKPIFNVRLSNKVRYPLDHAALDIVVEWPEDAVFVPSKHRRSASGLFRYMQDHFAELVYNGYVIETEERVFYDIDFFYNLHLKRVPVFSPQDYKSYRKHMPSTVENKEQGYAVRKFLYNNIRNQKVFPDEDRLEIYIPRLVRNDLPWVQPITPLAFLLSTEALRSKNKLDQHRALARDCIGVHDEQIPGRTLVSFLMSGAGYSSTVYL